MSDTRIRTLVPGDPSAVDNLSLLMARRADGADEARKELRAALGAAAGWQGEAGDGFRRTTKEHIDGAGELAARLRTASRALATCAGELSAAQRQAPRCLDIAEELRVSPDDLVDRNILDGAFLEWRGWTDGELDPDRVDALVEEFDRVLSAARGRAARAQRALEVALRPSTDEIMRQVPGR